MIYHSSMDNLVKRASDIIHSGWYTKDDWVELSRIEFDMSVKYYEAMQLLWKATDEFNKIRSDRTVELREAGKSMAESTETAKQIALNKISNLEEMENTCKWFKAVIDSVRAYKISQYIRDWETEQYTNSWMKDLSNN